MKLQWTLPILLRAPSELWKKLDRTQEHQNCLSMPKPYLRTSHVTGPQEIGFAGQRRALTLRALQLQIDALAVDEHVAGVDELLARAVILLVTMQVR